MVFIVGGSHQGKLEYGMNLVENRAGLSVADGSTDSYEQAYEAAVIHKFHVYIKRMLESAVQKPQQIGAEAFLNQFICGIIEANPEVIIIMDEIGCGIVPMDPSERTYRDMAGRIGQRLAKEADQVHRVICGIGTRIK